MLGITTPKHLFNILTDDISGMMGSSKDFPMIFNYSLECTVA